MIQLVSLISKIMLILLTTELFQIIHLSFFTAKEGLPENRVIINGLKEREVNPPVIERTERTDRENKFAGSAFGEAGRPILIGGGIAILTAAVVGGITIKKRKKNGTDAGKDVE